MVFIEKRNHVRKMVKVTRVVGSQEGVLSIVFSMCLKWKKVEIISVQAVITQCHR